MISEVKFTRILTQYRDWVGKMEHISVITECDVTHSSWYGYVDSLLVELLGVYFTKEGIDVIMSFIYEGNKRGDSWVWDKDGRKVMMQSIKQLWKLVNQYRK